MNRVLILMGVLLCNATLFSPLTNADTADIPALTVNPITIPYSYHFNAIWLTNDGASLSVGSTQFYSAYGDSAPLPAEVDQTAQAPFAYNITNFRVAAASANCGGLGAGQSLTYIVRRNAANTVLQGNCTNGAAQNSFTVDTDILQVNAGDRITVSVTLTGGITAVGPRVGITAEGYRNVTTQSLEGTTLAVVDMVNELLEVVNLVMPIVFLILALVWAELSKEWLVYALAGIAGIIATIAVWTEIETLRILLVAATLLILARGYFARRDLIEVEDEE